jgi:hypothetical protein
MSSDKRKREAKKKEKTQRRQAWETRKRAKQTASPSRPALADVAPVATEEILLYHGTSGHRAEAMNAQGIIPRQGGTCNWPDRPGRPDCVYLTSVWGLTYALHALSRLEMAQGGQEGAILEVRRLDGSLLLPDEDFLFECVTMYYPEEESAERQEHLLGTVLPEIRDELENYAGQDWLDRLNRKYDGRVHEWASNFSGQYGWEASLAGLGTCAYRGTIPTSLIKRTAFFPGNHPAFADISRLKPTSMEHLSLKAGLETVNRWVFQDGPAPPHPVFNNREGFRVTSKSS